MGVCVYLWCGWLWIGVDGNCGVGSRLVTVVIDGHTMKPRRNIITEIIFCSCGYALTCAVPSHHYCIYRLYSSYHRYSAYHRYT